MKAYVRKIIASFLLFIILKKREERVEIVGHFFSAVLNITSTVNRKMLNPYLFMEMLCIVSP